MVALWLQGLIQSCLVGAFDVMHPSPNIEPPPCHKILAQTRRGSAGMKPLGAGLGGTGFAARGAKEDHLEGRR